jgi:small subunit ribosomal protein S19
MKSRRSSRKPPYVPYDLLQKVEQTMSTGSKAPIKVYRRGATIITKFVGYNFLVHNGKTFVQVYINDSMVGYKFGEFVPTRKFTGHSGKKGAK